MDYVPIQFPTWAYDPVTGHSAIVARQADLDVLPALYTTTPTFVKIIPPTLTVNVVAASNAKQLTRTKKKS